jgi:hypothetical protein
MNALARMIFLCLLSLPAVGQNDVNLPQVQHKKVRDRIEAARIAYITDQLELTPQEAEKFWPIYREFTQQRREIRREIRETTRHADPNKTDQEIVDQQFQMKQKELDLEKDYSGRLLKVISAQKLRSLPQAERRFRQMILDQIQRRQIQYERKENFRDRKQQQLQEEKID